MSVHRCVHLCRCLERPEVSAPLELEFLGIVSHPVWVLGTKQRGHLSRPNIQLFLFIVTALQLGLQVCTTADARCWSE